MNSPSNDRRVKRTKDAIEEAFIATVKEKGYESTKISEIVTRANINRGTFYLHYQDKYDLREQLEQNTLDGLKSQVVKAEKKYRQTMPVQNFGYEQLFIFILNYMKTHKERIQILFSLGGENSFRQKLNSLLLENLSEGLYPTMAEKNFQVPSSFWGIYIASADIGVIEYWLAGGCTESVEEVADILTKLFFHTYL